MSISISFSNLRQFSACAEQWRRAVQYREPRPPNSALPVGSVVHTVRDRFIRRCVIEGQDFTDEERLDYLHDQIRSQITHREIHFTDEERQDIPGTLRRLAEQAAKLHHKDYTAFYGTLYSAKSVERTIRVEVEGWPYKWSGRIDSEHVSEQGHEEVKDLKTGKGDPETTEVLSLQLTMYQHLKALIGEPTDILSIDWITKHAEPRAFRLKSPARTEEEIEPLIRRAEYFCDMVEHERYPPADPTSWRCSPNWCGYWEDCPYSTRSRRPKT